MHNAAIMNVDKIRKLSENRSRFLIAMTSQQLADGLAMKKFRRPGINAVKGDIRRSEGHTRATKVFLCWQKLLRNQFEVFALAPRWRGNFYHD